MHYKNMNNGVKKKKEREICWGELIIIHTTLAFSRREEIKKENDVRNLDFSP